MNSTAQREDVPLRTRLAYLFALLSLSGCSHFDDSHDHPDLTSGKALYNHHCSGCHGEDGTGKLANGMPASIHTNKSHSGVVDYVTKDKGLERKMPVFKNMSSIEASQITSHLFVLKSTHRNSLNNK